VPELHRFCEYDALVFKLFIGPAVRRCSPGNVKHFIVLAMLLFLWMTWYFNYKYNEDEAHSLG
jgi:hypothetical protein